MPEVSPSQNASILHWRYSVTELGTLPGFTGAVPGAINNQGHVAGVASNKTHSRLFLWRDGKMQDCGCPEGYNTLEVASLNSKDEFAGIARLTVNDLDDESVAPFAFIYRQSKLHHIAMPANCRCEQIAALNEQGQVVGSCSDKQQFHAFLFDGDTTRTLFAGAATGINNTGQIVEYSGRFTDDGGGTRSGKLVLWTNGTQAVLQNRAVYIPHTVTYFRDGQGAVVALGGKGLQVWTEGKRHNVPIQLHRSFLAAVPLSMNSQQHIVGYMGDDAGAYAMLIRDGHLVDMNTLFPDSFAHHLLFANGINDKDQVVCLASGKSHSSATQNYNARALLLNPQ